MSNEGVNKSVFALHHVQLSMPAGEEDVGRHFYIEVLGLTEIPKPAPLTQRGGFWVRADALEVHLGVESDFGPHVKRTPASWSATSTVSPNALLTTAFPLNGMTTSPGIVAFTRMTVGATDSSF